MHIARNLTYGLVAGAAGTVALNITTYLDMAVRARPASSVPAQTVRTAAQRADIDLAPGDDERTIDNRSEGIGALMGYASGLGFGALYGVLAPTLGHPPVPVGAAALTAAAMAGANSPSVALDVTDPREWDAEAWVGDIVPHVIYGLVTAAVHELIRD